MDDLILCKENYYNFLQLNASHKSQLIEQLSSSQRESLLKIINNKGEVFFKKNDLISLSKMIRNVKKTTIPLTRRHDKRLEITSIKKIINKNLDNLLYHFFNYLTACKANQLITSAINVDPDLKVDNKPRVSIQKLNKLIKKATSKAQPGEKVNLAKILEENGFSKEIKDLTFSKNFSLKDMDLEELTFTSCKFDWTPCSNSNLKNVNFKNCNIYNLSLMNSSLEGCIFDNCEGREVMFTGAKLDGIAFHTSTFISSSFEDASLTNCLFSKSALPGTHFFEADVKDSRFIESNLKDTVFFGTSDKFQMDNKTKKTASVTRPTTAILIHPEARGITAPKAYMKLDQSSDTIPLRITMQAQKVTKEGVNNEVESALSKIGPYDRSKLPIPQRLITELVINPDCESARILRKAEKLASQVDSLFLPGGEDVPPALYGQEKGEKTDWGGDYRRSILELGLIHQSFTKGVPLMAVCRGFQMSNVYFGAQLIQHIDGHKGIQTFELSSPEKRGLYAEVMKNCIVSACFHHQAVSEESPAIEHLETAVRYQGLIKATELDKSGTAPMILLQFHPEFYKAATADSQNLEILDRCLNITMSKQNKAFWGILSDSAKAHRTKQAVLRKIPKAAILDESALSKRKAAIQELESGRAKVFDLYKKNYFNWKKGLLAVVKNIPEKLLERYLKPASDGELDRFSEEREALQAALRHDANFLKSLMNSKNRGSILKVIQETDPKLYEELEKGLLQPYLT